MTSKEKKPRKVQEDLRVVIRKLPPTLSEEIFLKSVQNYKDSIAAHYFIQGKNRYPTIFTFFTNQREIR
jgi:hypothetical protein